MQSEKPEAPSLNIHDLARHLNVSIGTVSRALNGRADVSNGTRKRVLDAAKRLGYSPNQSGRSLRRGATGMVGFMVIANRSRALKGDAFFMTVFDGLQSVLAKHSLDLVIYYCGADQNPETYVKRIVERRLVDGLIISQTTRIDHRIDYLIRQDLPFIAFGRSQSGGEHSWIDLDFESVAAQSIDHLYRYGHRRIAVATTSDEVNFGQVYLEACRAELARRGVRLTNDLILREPMSEAGGYHVGERLLALENRPTAVVVVENSMAIGLYTKLNEAGVLPGRDIAVVGFDRSLTNGLFLKPSLTQFSLSLVDLGGWLGEHLLALIDAKRKGAAIPFARKIWPMEMVVGGSTMPLPTSGEANPPETPAAEEKRRRRLGARPTEASV
jgi:DNA-binding LacI/PurR family transcriptional regulator